MSTTLTNEQIAAEPADWTVQRPPLAVDASKRENKAAVEPDVAPYRTAVGCRRGAVFWVDRAETLLSLTKSSNEVSGSIALDDRCLQLSVLKPDVLRPQKRGPGH